MNNKNKPFFQTKNSYIYNGCEEKFWTVFFSKYFIEKLTKLNPNSFKWYKTIWNYKADSINTKNN